MNKTGNFILSTRELQTGDLPVAVKSKNNDFFFYADEKDLFSFSDDTSLVYRIWMKGYILPIDEHAGRYKNLMQYELVKTLFLEKKENFIRFLKGIFIIAIVSERSYIIVNDRLGISRFFYTPGQAIISGSFWSLVNHTENRRINENSLLAYMATNNYMKGDTFLEDIKYSEGATCILFNSGYKHVTRYWDPAGLLAIGKSKPGFDEVAQSLKTTLSNHLSFLDPGAVYMSLTGGLDSRLILALLLNTGIKPLTFTYGLPGSMDVKGARELAGKLGLDHVHHTDDPSATWYENLSGEIILTGNAMSHPSRAHRYQAFRNVFDPGKKILYMGGYMGGEIIRNFNCDGNSCTWLTNALLEKKKNTVELLYGLHKDTSEAIYFINPEYLPVLGEYLSGAVYFSNDPRTNKFLYTFTVLAGLWHAQDIYLSMNFADYTLPFFLDHDVLCMLMSAGINLYYNPLDETNYYKRLRSHDFYARMISILSPELSDLPVHKQGYYSVNEYLNDPLPVFAAKRFSRRFRERKNIAVQNFALGGWMEEYVESRLGPAVERLDSLVDGRKVMEAYAREKHGTAEEYWRKYTNLIFISQVLEKIKII